MGIVVIGAIFLDIKGYPLYKYIPSGRNQGKIMHVYGGVCHNVVKDIAMLGLSPTFVSLVDTTPTGKAIIENIRSFGVNTDYIAIEPDGMGTWLAVFDETGDVVASISKRPVLQPIADIYDKHGDEIFKDCDAVVIEIDIDEDVVAKTFEYAEKYHKDVYAIVSNMSIARSRSHYVQKLRCLVCNQQEAALFFNDPAMEYDDERTMIKKLPDLIQKENVHSMVVTMGSRGAAYAAQDGTLGFVHANKVEVVDTTGAGDAFLAGGATGLTYGLDLRDSCRLASRMSEAVITTAENIITKIDTSDFELKK